MLVDERLRRTKLKQSGNPSRKAWVRRPRGVAENDDAESHDAGLSAATVKNYTREAVTVNLKGIA
jgi:hypothetical protein